VTADAKPDEDDEDEDTPTDRFLRKLIAHLVPGCSAKDKTPRFRCTQMLSEILRNVPTLEDELYLQAKQVLLERGMDKEWTIRSAACIGLGVLARGEAAADNEDEDESDEQGGEGSGPGTTIMDKLKALCRYDMDPHVRIACLPGMSLPLNPNTLPLLLSRTRDTDPSVRRISFRLLQQVPVRGLSVAQRSVIVRNGLGDREAAVRAEASKLIYQWAVACSDYDAEASGGQSKAQARQKQDVKIDLDEFIDLFDLWDGEVAEEALKAIIYRRSNVLDGLDLSQGRYLRRFMITETNNIVSYVLV
jgi:condensin complex subunit 3